MRVIKNLLPLFIGRGDPPITEEELLALAGQVPGPYTDALLAQAKPPAIAGVARRLGAVPSLHDDEPPDMLSVLQGREHVS